MYLKLLTGKYAGEIRDLAPEAARAMLASGRAVDPRTIPADEPQPEPSTPVPALSASSAVAKKTAAKKGARKRSRR